MLPFAGASWVAKFVIVDIKLPFHFEFIHEQNISWIIDC